MIIFNERIYSPRAPICDILQKYWETNESTMWKKIGEFKPYYHLNTAWYFRAVAAEFKDVFSKEFWRIQDTEKQFKPRYFRHVDLVSF